MMRGRREPPRPRREDRQNFVLSEYNKRDEGKCTWLRAAQAFMHPEVCYDKEAERRA
jgi:hypothetical protein